MTRFAFLILAVSFTALKTIAQQPALEHIAVYVHNLEKSTAFYQDIIGLDTIPEPFHDGRHTWFAVGGHAKLHLIGGAAAITDHDKNSHLCFTVPSVTDFMQKLQKNRVPFEDWNGKPQAATVRIDGVKQVYFKDPDGWWIEVNDAN
jgi:lactoylglutathione lyase